MKKKNNITELVFILDNSGSMCGLESDTVGGFNSVIKKQKKLDGKCYVSTFFFNSFSKCIHDRVDINTVKPLKVNDYTVGGCTALIDAIGDAVNHISDIHKYAREEDVPQNTMFVIITDGCENASFKYSSDKVKAMIEEKKKLGWEFVFIGANIDAVETAGNFGIDENRAVNYHADSDGTKVVYEAVSNLCEDVRMAQPVCSDWADDIYDDFMMRK